SPSSTLFPYTTLFRSPRILSFGAAAYVPRGKQRRGAGHLSPAPESLAKRRPPMRGYASRRGRDADLPWANASRGSASCAGEAPRSEEHTSELQSLAYL